MFRGASIWYFICMCTMFCCCLRAYCCHDADGARIAEWNANQNNNNNTPHRHDGHSIRCSCCCSLCIYTTYNITTYKMNRQSVGTTGPASERGARAFNNKQQQNSKKKKKRSGKQNNTNNSSKWILCDCFRKFQLLVCCVHNMQFNIEWEFSQSKREKKKILIVWMMCDACACVGQGYHSSFRDQKRTF